MVANRYSNIMKEKYANARLRVMIVVSYLSYFENSTPTTLKIASLFIYRCQDGDAIRQSLGSPRHN